MFETILGIDAGSTYTDVVVIQNGKLIAKSKIPTTTDATLGIVTGILDVLKTSNISADKVNYVMIGTTHLLNATLEHRLNKVAAIRLGLPATTAIPPYTSWPSELEKNVAALTYIINGGYEYNGQIITEIDYVQLEKIADELKDQHIELVAITGVFAHINSDQEIKVAQFLKKKLPNLKISLSHQMGGLGLLERENAAILNSSLKPIYMQICNGIHQKLLQLGLINAKIYLSHNDGTAERIDHFTTEDDDQIKPILTLNAGPTNSMRGAAILAELLEMKDAIVADFGGTSTDIGMILANTLIEINTLFKIAGVSLNFPTIKTHSIALGGGSIITNKDGKYFITNTSVGNKLLQEAICFGGTVLTATDIAVYKKRITLTSQYKQVVPYPDEKTMNYLDDLLHEKLAQQIAEFWSSSKEKPKNLLLIGGGSKLFDQNKLANLLKGKIDIIHIPTHAEVANALGATQGEISGAHSEIIDYEKISRDQAKKMVTEKAIAKAKSNGAVSDIKIKYIAEEEIQYVLGKPTVLTVKASGMVCENTGKIITNIISNTTTPLKPNEQKKEEIESIHPNKQVDSKYIDAYSELSNDTQLTAQKFQTEHVNFANSAIGSAFLGSGGGGDTRLSELMLTASLKEHPPINSIPLKELKDDALVVCFAMMGSPSVLEEKIPSKEEMTRSIKSMEEYLKKSVDAIITTEIGGTNGLLTKIIAAELGKLLPDADCMGRALPYLHMVTPMMNNKISDFVAVLSSAKETRFIKANNAFELENIARTYIVEMGGSACITFMPMSGKIAKEVCIPNTLTIAETIGKLFNTAKMKGDNPFPLINNYLKDTEYKKIDEVFNGRIEVLRRIEESGFSVGGAIIMNGDGQQATLVFQNENLQLTTQLANGYKKQLAIVPHLITVIDYYSLLPISCGQLKYGQKVRIVTMHSPKHLLSTEVYNIVGPKAYDLVKLSQLVEKNLPQTYTSSDAIKIMQEGEETQHLTEDRVDEETMSRTRFCTL